MWFTSFDLAHGYLQLAMDKADIHKTAFHAGSSGLYELLMPFGLSNAGASFCRLMEMCLGDQQYLTLLFYLDDICVFSSSIDKMLDRIALILNHLQDFNLKIKPTKSFFFQSNLLFLGHHTLSKDGISPNPKKVNKVREWPVPKTVKEVHSLLGLASYYHRFIPQFVKWANPLHDLIHPIVTKKKHAGIILPPLPQNLPPFQWTSDHQEAFDKLKLALTTAPVFGLPRL